MNRSKRLALAAVVGLSTGLSVVDLPAVRGVDPETPRKRRPDVGSETKPPVAPLRNPDWDGPRPPKSQPFPLRRGGGPPGPQFEREAIGERDERPRRPGTPFDREMAELEERRRDLVRREFERRERAERERDEREMIERERHEREHHERQHHGRMLELRMQELELRRKEIEVQIAEMELEKRHGEMRSSAAKTAIATAIGYMQPEAAADFLSSVLSETDDPRIRQMIRQQLAEIHFRADRPDQAAEQLRQLITK